MESMSACLTSWIQGIVRLELPACSWSQAADLERTESVTLPALRHSITWKVKVTGDTPEGGEDPGNAHELLQHPETLPPLTVEEELVYVGTAANRCIEVGTTALEHRHSHGGELGNKLVVERSVVQLVPLVAMRGGGDPVRGVQESQNLHEGVNSSQIFQDKGAEPSLGGQHDARALGHGVVIGMPGGDTLASVRVRGPGLVAEVIDLSHRSDSWQVGGEAGGQGISLFTPSSLSSGKGTRVPRSLPSSKGTRVPRSLPSS